MFCRDKIHSLSDWRKATLSKKAQLRDAGVIDFENHPEYRALVQCKSNLTAMPSEDDCKKNNVNREFGFNAFNDRTPEARYTPKGYKRRFPKKPVSPEPQHYNPRKDNPYEDYEAWLKRHYVRLNSPRAKAPKAASATPKTSTRCPKGTRRNKKTGNCDPAGGPSYQAPPPPPAPTTPPPRHSPPRSPKTPPGFKRTRCPKGTHRNKKTGNCDPVGGPFQQPPPPPSPPRSPKTPPGYKKTRCPKGTRRNKKTGNCDPH
jgi:hypothetical protein